jgi:hypothetical protein
MKTSALWWALTWSGHVAVLQLCANRHCLVFQICHDYVPIALARFLADSRFTFIRVGVRVGADKLCAGYGLEVGNAADLHDLTKMLSPDRDVSSMMSSSELGNGTGLVQWCH